MLLVNRDQDLKIHHITNLEQNVRFFAHSNDDYDNDYEGMIVDEDEDDEDEDLISDPHF